MKFARRELFAATPTALAATIVAPGPGFAAGPSDLAVSCDAAAASAMRADGAAYRGAGGYNGGIDMATALHPRTLMAFKLADDILPTPHGYPFKIPIPTKLGSKNPEFVTTLNVTNQQPRGFWPDRGYNWFSGI